MKSDKRICFSSEVYKIDPRDLDILEDSTTELPKDAVDEVILLIGNDKLAINDTLLAGRETVKKNIETGVGLCPVRIAFVPRVGKYDFISPIVRALRYRYRTYSSNIYHVDPKDIRKLKIERGMRTSENAYQLSNPKWRMSKEEGQKRYNELKESMMKGYDDNSPIDIMLCRNFGIKDNVNQGHHRMGVAMECGLPRIAVKFSAVGQSPKILHPFFKVLAKISGFFKF